MFVVVCYDVATESEGGKKRLRRVAKICGNNGQRVQHSVFECQLDWSQFLVLRANLLREMDEKQDSLRFYLLGNRHESKVVHYGVKENFDLQTDTLLL